MPEWRIAPRLALLALALAVGLVLVVVSSLRPASAHAGPLDGLTAPVNEATAPVVEAVETVVTPPASAPPVATSEVRTPEVQVPSVTVPEAPVKTPLPPVSTPEVKVPSVTAPAVKAPSSATAAALGEAATDGVEAATETVTKVTGTAGSPVAGVTDEVTQTVGAAAGTVQTAAGDTTAAVQGTLGTRSNTADGSAGGAQAAADSSSAEAGGPAAGNGVGDLFDPIAQAADAPAALRIFPARVLEPFIHVWPAVALLARGPLGAFVGHWSQSVLALLEGNGGAGSSLRSASGTVGALADSASPSGSSGQPPFSWPDSLAPFDWTASQSALVVLVLFLVIGASTLVIFALGRHELGLPMFRRGNRFPWRR